MSWQLASRGLRVIGVDRFSIPGRFSAYAGGNAHFPQAIRGRREYTPLLQRAQDLWRDLEKVSRTRLLNATGAGTRYDEHNPRLASLIAAAQKHDLDCELQWGEEARTKYPEHVIRDTDVTIVDPEGGYLNSEKLWPRQSWRLHGWVPRSWETGKRTALRCTVTGTPSGPIKKRSLPPG